MLLLQQYTVQSILFNLLFNAGSIYMYMYCFPLFVLTFDTLFCLTGTNHGNLAETQIKIRFLGCFDQATFHQHAGFGAVRSESGDEGRWWWGH